MKKLVVTTAVALVLAGSAYAQGHNHGGGGGGGGGFGAGAAMSGGAHGGGGGAAFNGGAHVGGGAGPGQSMMSRGPSAQSNLGASGHLGSGHNGSQFSRMDRGPQGRTVYNQAHGNRTLYNRFDDRDRGREEFGRDRDRESFGRDRGRDMDIGHRGVVRGNFFEHGRRFGFRRFWHNEWVYLTDWDSCTAWAWVHVAPGVWTWRPIDVCVG